MTPARPGRLVASLASLPPTSLLAAVGATMAGVMLGAVRWRSLLAAGRVQAPASRLFAALTIGSAVNNLVSARGGDAVRVESAHQPAVHAVIVLPPTLTGAMLAPRRAAKGVPAPQRARRGCCIVFSGMQAAQSQKGADFRALHEGEAFIIPNPWDAGSARVLEALGFKALATTSSGFAFTLGRLDGATTLDEVLDHVRVLDRATALPVSVDLEYGYGPEPEAAASAVTAAAGAGAVGGSIEDYDPEGRIYSFDHAVERVAAACEAAHRLSFPFTFTARAENLIRGNPDLDDTIARLQAYERAGADVLYAPGLRSADEIRSVCDATSKPVNVLAHAGLSMREIVDAGARRISVGGALAWASVAAVVAAAEKMRDDGDFSLLAGSGRINEWLG